MVLVFNVWEARLDHTAQLAQANCRCQEKNCFTLQGVSLQWHFSVRKLSQESKNSSFIQCNSLHSPPPSPYHTHTHTHTHTQSWFSEDKPWVVYWFPRVQSLEELNCECNLKNQSQPHSLGECDEWGRNCSFAQSSK